ncbi:MAG TPA: amylo-alpha-1,6-glucosidase [Ktedonobacterales bacterium]|jgi:predicted glycogen debranching enzyme|nr:amylo-alpha-1,6-glucosidase [Ktedonobacterales bacterium]
MSTLTPLTTVIDQPLVHFGREICGSLTDGLRREWLVTNGLGSYASGTLAGINTRSYHGLLVAALSPPVNRTVLVGGLVEWVTYAGHRYPLSSGEYADGTIDPHGYRHLQTFALEGTLPVWTFALGNALLERRIWMDYGSSTTHVRYRWLGGDGEMRIEITPLVTYRDFHSLSSGQGWEPGVEAESQKAIVHAFDGATPFALIASDGAFTPGGAWWWNFKYRAETERGLNDHGDLYAPGTFTTELRGGGGFALTLTTDLTTQPQVDAAHAAFRERQRQLLRTAGAEDAHPAVQQLTLAADQFIVQRQDVTAGPVLAGGPASAEPNTTVIAGYHWFNDWGRDTMIALRGLTLATGRPRDAANVLRSFARYVQDGLLPNNFPDRSGVIPGYNTADATLWFVIALYSYTRATDDRALIDELLPVLKDIVAWHIRGTRYHIGVDPKDDLLRAGEPGVQLTWMDAKVGDLVVTPRIGKPVEINALWYNTLCILAEALAACGDPEAAAEYEARSDRVRASFLARFLRPEYPYLADVVDSPTGDDFTLRPNQIFAVSLPFPLLQGAEAASVVDEVGRLLLTSYGLRSLSPDDPSYRGAYSGDQYERDTSYHQGPVWTWLIGAYAEAHYRAFGDPKAALELLAPCEDHLRDAGLGTVSEILEGDPPHAPKGCIAQAWGVAEILRMWRQLDQEADTSYKSTVGAQSALQPAQAGSAGGHAL